MIVTTHRTTDQPHNCVLDITPAMAEQWLETNKDNRRLNWSYVAQLSRDIQSDDFPCTHQGIAFDTAGRLIDGQHRLWAIVDANKPVRMRVFFNEPSDQLPHIDANTPRQVADRMTLGRTLGTVRTDELATLRAMLGGLAMSDSRRTLRQEMELLEQHRAALHFAHEHLPVTRPAGLANAMTRAVVGRAWYCVSEEAPLARFCKVLRTGVAGGDWERSIVLLRDQLLDLRRQGISQTARQRQYALTSRAMVAYLRHESLTILRAPTCELIPLPEEVRSS